MAYLWCCTSFVRVLVWWSFDVHTSFVLHSGGVTLTFHGTNVDVAQNPQLVFSNNNMAVISYELLLLSVIMSFVSHSLTALQ